MPKSANTNARRTLATIEDLFSDLLPQSSAWRTHPKTNALPIARPVRQPRANAPDIMPAEPADAAEPHSNKVRYFRDQLRKLYGNPIEIVLNRNFSTYISFCRPKRGQPPRLSVHMMFLEGGPEIVQALAQFAKRPTTACRNILREFMNTHQNKYEKAAARNRTICLRTRGAVYDLGSLSREVCRAHFGKPLDVRITWGRAGTPSSGRKRRRHIVFGSYNSTLNLVRIHPVLDHRDVPDYFLKFVLYHELLHAVLGEMCTANGRRSVHSPEFRRREAEFPDYARALAWEKKFMEQGFTHKRA